MTRTGNGWLHLARCSNSKIQWLLGKILWKKCYEMLCIHPREWCRAQKLWGLGFRAAGWWKRDRLPCSDVVPLLEHGCLQEGKCEKRHKMNCFQLILIKYCLIPSCVERRGNVGAPPPEIWALEEEESAALGFGSWRYGVYVNTAFVSPWKGAFCVCIAPPLGTRAHHFSLTRQQKAGWGCSPNKSCQTLPGSNSSQLPGTGICLLFFSGLEVLMGCKCHLTLGQIGSVSNLLRRVRLKHFKTNKWLLSLLLIEAV